MLLEESDDEEIDIVRQSVRDGSELPEPWNLPKPGEYSCPRKLKRGASEGLGSGIILVPAANGQSRVAHQHRTLSRTEVSPCRVRPPPPRPIRIASYCTLFRSSRLTRTRLHPVGLVPAIPTAAGALDPYKAVPLRGTPG